MTAFDRAWSIVKGKPPVEIEEEPHENEAWIVGPEIDCPECGKPGASMIREPADEGGMLTLACQECGYGGNMSSLFDPRLGDIGLHVDTRALSEAQREPK